MSEEAENVQIDFDRDKLIEILTEELPSLRARIGVTQEELSHLVGISRPTYSAIETKKEKCHGMSSYRSLCFSHKTKRLSL